MQTVVSGMTLAGLSSGNEKSSPNLGTKESPKHSSEAPLFILQLALNYSTLAPSSQGSVPARDALYLILQKDWTHFVKK